MARPNASEGTADLDAGDFTTWLGMIELSIRTGAESDVPCGSCTACCTSGQFVHIAPDEVATIAAIPAPLLFPAPGAPPGHVLLGYDENGHCPMLIDGACSIYEQRPRTCRAYDCRVFAATGVTPDADKPAIAARVSRWRFTFADGKAIATATALRERAAAIEPGPSATQRAVRAIEDLGA